MLGKVVIIPVAGIFGLYFELFVSVLMMVAGVDNNRLIELVNMAQARGQETGCPYAGLFNPAEAYEVLQLSPDAKLVDVRSRAELVWVGRVPCAIEIEWMSYPGNHPNPDFIEQLKRQADMNSIVMMLCRVGMRSHKAAALAFNEGFMSCYNVLYGFEGDLDPVTGQRGRINGWRHANLPWKS